MKKKVILLISLTLILLLFSTNVLAQNWLEELFGPFFKGLNMAEFYSNYSPAIDFIIAFMVFLSIAKVTFAQRFPGRPGTAISVALSFALAFGFSLFLNQLGINLGRLGPIAVVIFILAIGLAFYRYFTGLGAGAPGVGALLYVIIYLLITVSFPELIEWVEEQSSTLFLIFHAAFIISLIYSCIVFWGLLKGSRETTEFGRDLGRGAGAVGRGLGAAGRGLGRAILRPGEPSSPTGPEPVEPITGLTLSRLKNLIDELGMEYRLWRRLKWTDPPISYLQKLQEKKGRFEKGFAYFCSQVVNREKEPFHYSLSATFITAAYAVFEKFREELKRISPHIYKKLDEDLQIAVNETKEGGVLTEKYWELPMRIAYGVEIPPGTSADALVKKEYKENLQKFVNDIGGANELKKRINRVSNTLRAVQDIVTNWEIMHSNAAEIYERLRKQVKELR